MQKQYFIKRVLIVLCFFFGSQALHAQDILKGNDLSQVKVDQLSDADIAKLKAQLSSSGMTIEQAEQMALSKGMPASEFLKLKQRLSLNAPNTGSGTGKLKSGTTNQSSGRVNNSSDTLDTEKYNEKPPRPLIDPLIFGSELYTSVSPNFEPNMKLATPMNYILGPDDEISISVYGVQEYNGDLLVSSEGAISVPNVGQVKIAGLSIEAATQKLRSVMANSVYPSLRGGGSKLSVTLSKIRSIKVTVIGSVYPNNYNLSSLSTVFNALYVAGGPSAFGSFREIELVRDNKVIRKIDLYRLLLHGDQSDNIGLKDNDVIRIPAYKKRVELQGQLKRPGIFEVLPGETFADILEFASGFTDTAYQATVKIFQRSDKERKIQDLEANAFDKYQPQSGDIFVTSKILNRYENRVRIVGAVFRPDIYQLTSGLRVADLIRRADGLKEDAFTGRGQIIRLQEDLSRSILSFDIRKALANDPENNKLLQREDEVLISSVLDLRDSFKVVIQGEVRLPGEYDYVDNLTLKDIILQAGGFTDAASKNIEIARLIKRDSLAATDSRASVIINTEVNGDLTSATGSTTLQPFDMITVRRKAGYVIPEAVIISGQVQYPGPYALSSRNERVSDVVRRAGGYTPDAYPEGAFLKRFKTNAEKAKAKEDEEIVKKLQRTIKDSSSYVIEEIGRDYDQIPLDLPLIMAAPGSVADLVVRSRDEIIIPSFDAQVKISGSVLLVTQVPYQKSNTMKDYINEAGGFSADAWRKKAYVIYANGKAATISRFLFFKFYPKVLPGSKLVVPSKPEKRSASTGEIIGIASALASLAGVVIAILRL